MKMNKHNKRIYDYLQRSFAKAKESQKDYWKKLVHDFYELANN